MALKESNTDEFYPTDNKQSINRRPWTIQKTTRKQWLAKIILEDKNDTSPKIQYHIKTWFVSQTVAAAFILRTCQHDYYYNKWSVTVSSLHPRTDPGSQRPIFPSGHLFKHKPRSMCLRVWITGLVPTHCSNSVVLVLGHASAILREGECVAAYQR